MFNSAEQITTLGGGGLCLCELDENVKFSIEGDCHTQNIYALKNETIEYM